jgi:hypothetical protein
MSDDRLERELILRRILVERAKGTPFEELTEIIRDMVESQRLVASFVEQNSSPDSTGSEN